MSPDRLEPVTSVNIFIAKACGYKCSLNIRAKDSKVNKSGQLLLVAGAGLMRCPQEVPYVVVERRRSGVLWSEVHRVCVSLTVSRVQAEGVV